MTLWLFPIEPLEERYSADWLRWWPRELQRLGVDTQVIMGKRLRDGIEDGQFLDAVDTHYFKATQLASFCKQIQGGQVRAGDSALLLDGWNPEVSSLAYMRDALKLDLRLYAVLHAGCWDQQDFIAQAGMTPWARHVERGWFEALAGVFVATHFHANLLMAWGCPADKIHVTGLSLYPECVTDARLHMQRERVVVFPHRLAPEKRPEDFDRVRELYHAAYGDDGTRWVRTKDLDQTKAGYYDTLATSRVAFSSATQETWGIAMIEAALLGCWPVAPKRLSYPETLPQFEQYTSLEQAVDLIHTALDAGPQTRYSCRPWEQAIERIVSMIPGAT